MDESGDYFRVATTSQFWTQKGSVQYNNVYVMDKNLEIAGKLEEIAPDERIYSTRFIGNRLFVTEHLHHFPYLGKGWFVKIT